MTNYESEISNLVFLNLFVIMIVILSPLVEKNTFSWVFSILGMLFLVELVIRILTTFYIIDNKTLTVKSGMWINKKIDISSIKKITRTNDIGWSVALSSDSLRILYEDAKQVIVSPKNKKQFLNDLTSIHPDLVMP